MSKPREFWIDTENDESWPLDLIDGTETGMIHVIEISAVESLRTEHEKLRLELKGLKKAYELLWEGTKEMTDRKAEM